MGNIRPTYIKRVASELIEKFPDEFNDEFEHNKVTVEALSDVQGKVLRNRIAGYITRRVNQGVLEDELEPEAEGEEAEPDEEAAEPAEEEADEAEEPDEPETSPEEAVDLLESEGEEAEDSEEKEEVEDEADEAVGEDEEADDEEVAVAGSD